MTSVQPPPVNNNLTYWRKTSIIGKLIGVLAPWQEGSYLLQYGDILATVIICLVIIAAPFTSNTLVGVLLLAGGGLWSLLTIAEVKNNHNQLTATHLWIFAYLLTLIVATAFSSLKIIALSGLIKFSLYLLFFALVSRTLRHPKLLSWVTTVYLLVSLIVSAYGIRQEIIGVEPLATWTDPNSVLANDTRVYSYLGNPNLLASYLIPAFAFSLAALIVWQTWIQKSLAGVAFAVNTACIYFTDSRAGWLALVATGVVFLLAFKFWWSDYLSPFWRKWLIPIVIIFFIGLLGIAFIFVNPLRIRILSMFAGRGDSSANFRFNVWMAAIEMIKDNPLTGIGPGNGVFNKIYPYYMQTKYTALSTYSIFLEVTSEAGVFALVSFLGLIIATCIRGIKLIRHLKITKDLQSMWVIASLATMAGLATQGIVDTVWYRPQINTLWWLCVGIICAIPFISEGQNSKGKGSNDSD